MPNENLIIDEKRAKADERQNIANRKALKLSTNRKKRLLAQGKSTQDIIDSTLKPSLATNKPLRKRGDFEKALRNHEG